MNLIILHTHIFMHGSLDFETTNAYMCMWYWKGKGENIPYTVRSATDRYLYE